MLAEIFVSFVTIFILWKFITKFIKSDKSLRDIPGPKGFPLIGNIELGTHSNEQILSLLSSYVEKFGRRYKFYLGLNPYVVICNAEDAEKILSSQAHLEKSRDYEFTTPWLRYGLLTSKGQKWHTRRKMLTPAFHFKILEDFLIPMNEHSQLLVKILKDNHENGEVFDVFPYITRLTLDMICETAMGKKINAQTLKDHSEYVQAIKRITEVLLHRMFSPWLHPNLFWKLSPSGREETRLLKILHSFTSTVIQERQVEMKKTQSQVSRSNNVDPDLDFSTSGKKRKAFLDLLLETQQENPNSLSNSDIQEEVDTFMFEGHDTTTSAVNWTIYFLGLNLEAQKMVQDELEDIFGRDKSRPITMDDLSKMKYLEMCIKETMRIYPSVPFMGRELATEFKLDMNTTLPPKTTIWTHIYFIHRDPKVFPDPEIFIPERFLHENSSKRHPYAYIPFSAGPRNCIGQKFAMMELKVTIANIFRNFNVKSLDPKEEMVVKCEFITKPKNGINIQLQCRN